MALTKFKKGDTVQVITGKDKGKTGKVLEVAKNDFSIMVEGLGLVIKHRRPRKSNEKGQKLTRPTFFAQSKVMLVCSNCGKLSRVSIVTAENGEKSRVCKKCNRTV
ncbi:MAG: 50S ribosomal protein L24 [Candidatus Doudnabacteria bacterium RIFCSPHIGHO2_02_FULL_46_11]|uniref:Large ribosomal subunit protein uL24 n=1 Tax=Candidatus Doudnabacteria bacterium RIFCSPHIGHO2_02_FULL_46_11 TaxID=1817832 RepID=A0A1F5P5L2_9BACT|nr:ribosomal protein L24 [uncultured bacterium]OGE85104.1 MAG: 50S ribosomal protein L24 [Candidatus Doudnabacteria bacterium RIFCSPHIGHO2_02_FULL_46_11]